MSLSNSKQGAAGAASKYHRFHDDSPFADKGKGGGSAQVQRWYYGSCVCRRVCYQCRGAGAGNHPQAPAATSNPVRRAAPCLASCCLPALPCCRAGGRRAPSTSPAPRPPAPQHSLPARSSLIPDAADDDDTCAALDLPLMHPVPPPVSLSASAAPDAPALLCLLSSTVHRNCIKYSASTFNSPSTFTQ